MVLGDYIVGRLDISYQNVPVLHVNTELLLQSLMHLDRCFNVGVSSLIAPVGVERNRNSLNPSLPTFHRSGSTLLSLS
jgi:hypothetical protein